MDDGVGRRVDHCLVVDGREMAVHQLKLVLSDQHGPDGLDLNVREALAYAAMTACNRAAHAMDD